MASDQVTDAARPYPCVESTVDVTVADKTVRLWIDQRRVPTVLPAHREVVAEIQREVMRRLPPAFFEWLKQRVPYLSAAQLIRTDPMIPASRVGVVVYYVNFEEGWLERIKRTFRRVAP